MPFLQGLRAGGSRLAPAPIVPRRPYRRVQIPKPHFTPIRHVSYYESAEYAAELKKNEGALEDFKKAAKEGRTVKISDTTNIQIMESVTDAPLPLTWWINFRGGLRDRWDFLKERYTRRYQNRIYASMMQKVRLTDEEEAVPTDKKSLYPARLVLPRIERVFDQYHLAMTSGDLKKLPQLATGKALRSGEAVARTKKTITWQLLVRGRPILVDRVRSHNYWLPSIEWYGWPGGITEYPFGTAQPRLIWLRASPIAVDESAFLLQSCVLLDTVQALEVNGNKKVKRVQEYWVFQRKIPEETEWKVKEKIEPSPPMLLSDLIALSSGQRA